MQRQELGHFSPHCPCDVKRVNEPYTIHKAEVRKAQNTPVTVITSLFWGEWYRQSHDKRRLGLIVPVPSFMFYRVDCGFFLPHIVYHCVGTFSVSSRNYFSNGILIVRFPFRPEPAFLHRLIQWGFLLFMLAVGIQFALFVRWAMSASEFFVPRPPAVEAFLPISALLALKRLLLTGAYDSIHPAGLTILLLGLTLALLARKSFCGLLCPIGTVSGMLFRLGKRLGVAWTPPRWLALLLTLPKYVLLLFFVQILLVAMGGEDIEFFLRSRYNLVADSKMLLFFLPPAPLTLAILGILLCGSLVLPGFWCRGFCPYGALLGLISLCSPLAVRRNPSLCSQCGKCARACPSGIPVQRRLRVSDPECVGCLECVSACPQQDCLSLHAGYTKARSFRLPWWGLAALTLLLVAAFYLWARVSGHWESSIPQGMFRLLHEGIRSLQHF